MKFGDKTSSATVLENRNFDIRFFEINPKLNLQISRKLRFTLGYEFKDKENITDSTAGNATVSMHKFAFDTKINLKERNNIFAKIEFAKVAQNGSAPFAVEYELRESLLPGFNILWQSKTQTVIYSN